MNDRVISVAILNWPIPSIERYRCATATNPAEISTIAAPSQRLTHTDPERPLEERLDALLSLMTVEEKVAALGSVDCGDLLSAQTLDPEKLSTHLAHGCASITGVAAFADGDALVYQNTVEALTEYLQQQTRLGVPAFICESPAALSGLLSPELDILQIAMAASFDPGAVSAYAERLRDACLALGINQLLAPSLALDPERRMLDAGRSFGGDAYLAGRLGVAFLRGMRGDKRASSVLACAGRFLAEAAADADWRHASVGRRELRERFAEPFSVVIREGGLAALLVADMTIDGVPCTGAAEVLGSLLREDLGYRGFVISTGGGIANLVDRHRVAADRRDAVVQALRAGVDVEMGGDCFAAELGSAVDEGRLSETMLDRAVRRVLASKLQLGLLDISPEEDQSNPAARRAPLPARVEFEPAATALHERAVVMLQNRDSLLPLVPRSRLLLLGDRRAMLLTALQAQGLDVVHRSDPGNPDELPIDGRVAVICLDDTVGSDPASADIADAVRHLAQTQTPIIAILAGESIRLAARFATGCAALIINWQQSMGSTRAVAGVLTGLVNPSGRLPLTLRAPTAEQTMSDFPFGLGLSYSHFEYRALHCPETVDSHGAVEVSVEVINESDRAGAEVAQLYCHDPVAETARPQRQLVGFHRLELAPGQAKRISFQLDVSQFAYYNRQLEYVVEPGRIELLCGPSSRDIRARADLDVQGDLRVFKQQQRLATQSRDQELSP